MPSLSLPMISLSTHILVIGGGITGPWAAAVAAKAGAAVIMVDKGYCGTSGVTARMMIFARQTCLCGLLWLETAASSLLRSAAFNRIFVRSCILQPRTREPFGESPSESKC
jgi:glycine/D-amino acid oxidase-like deaminating enzyme